MSAWAAYTLPELGTYTATLKATEAGNNELYEKTATLTVTEGGVKSDSSSGGCNAAGLGVMALAALLLLRRR